MDVAPFPENIVQSHGSHVTSMPVEEGKMGRTNLGYRELVGIFLHAGT
jgi:hypothetical protein